MRDTKKAPGGVKVTFIDTATKLLAEKKLSAHGSNKQKSKQSPFIFTSSQVAPVEFSEDRKAMEHDDWIKLVEDFVLQGGDPDLWVTEPDTVKKCQVELIPSLTFWTEAQDPLHRPETHQCGGRLFQRV